MAQEQEQHSLLRSLIGAGSFDDATLRILQSLLVSKDVESSMQVRCSFTAFFRSQFLSVIRSIASKSVQEKLFILDFFVRAFAIVGDVESCLALRYEALLMRTLKSASCQWLDVSPVEWLNFVEDALHNGFHSIAEKACQHALLCIGKNDMLEPGIEGFSENAEAIRTITRLRNRAMKSVASSSVQAQAAEYLTRKSSEQGKLNSISEEKQCPASTSFRNGIKRQNMRKLQEQRSLLQINDE
ncbi:uncharacterized protein LOC114748234 [Neltuma alba]|uniref:uncharacterized protein LOC114726524 n=1 Tax=Neltuma alba TaxID=207710 RepID=UPI0010A4B80A|nr:uncharacterized protein LOC114726524 [Prosopis alba]XP_028792430.1 uncharacterized protein LOC114748234 [Prosopis alba]